MTSSTQNPDLAVALGRRMTDEQWQDGEAKCFGMLLDGHAQETGFKRRGSDATMLLV